MHQVIAFTFDAETERKIAGIQDKLADSGCVNARAGHPHFTIMSSEPADMAQLKEQLDVLAPQLRGERIRFSHVGIFPGDEPLLFLAVTHTERLMAVHKALFDLISPSVEVFHYVNLDVFVFHCTLAFLKDQAAIGPAMNLACGSEWPRSAMLDRLVVFLHPTGEILESYDLSSQGDAAEPDASPVSQ